MKKRVGQKSVIH